MHDIIIIGGGPAGLSAAITARARNKDVLVVSNSIEDNPLAASKQIDNYPGLPKAEGLQLLEAMQDQAQELGAQFLKARVISIVPIEQPGDDEDAPAETTFSVTTSSDYVEAKALVIACGAISNSTPLRGELENLGRGVSYCATCDGMLYKESKVLIVGLSPEAIEEANFMAELGATVFYYPKDESAALDPRITQQGGRLLAIEGDESGVKRVRFSEQIPESQRKREWEVSRSNPHGNYYDDVREIRLEVDGVFVLRPAIAPASMLSTLEVENGYIKVDENMGTSVKGVFAAGDCTGKPLQIAKAVGQGQTAVLSAVEYL